MRSPNNRQPPPKGFYRATASCGRTLLSAVFLSSISWAPGGGSEALRAIPPDADQRVAKTRSFLAHNRDCAAHRSLQWLAIIRPHGIYFADGAFAAKRYEDAFEAYKGVVAVSRMDNPSHPAALNEVLSYAKKADYQTAVAAIRKIPPPNDDLTHLIVGSVYFAAGRRVQAKVTWITGIGNTAVPGGSPLYRGASLSLLFLLDRMILAPECSGKKIRNVDAG